MRELKVDVPGVSAYYDYDYEYLEFLIQGEEIVCWCCEDIEGANRLVKDFENIFYLGFMVKDKITLKSQEVS